MLSIRYNNICFAKKMYFRLLSSIRQQLIYHSQVRLAGDEERHKIETCYDCFYNQKSNKSHDIKELGCNVYKILNVTE